MAKDSQYDAIERKNIANILAKLKDGKTLTASDNKALENHRRKEEGLRPKLTEAELAKEFGVNRRGSIVRWKKKNAPFAGTDQEMYKWLIVNDIRGADDWKLNYVKNNPDLFPKKPKSTARTNAKKPESKSAEELRDEYLVDLQFAKETGDEAREKMALNAYLKIEKQLRDSEAHAKKLGIDRGEVLPRSDVERILKAMFWSGNACLDKFSKTIAERLSRKEPAEIYDILAPLLTSVTLFQSLKKVGKTPGKINLPEWIIKCSQEQEDQYVDYE